MTSSDDLLARLAFALEPVEATPPPAQLERLSADLASMSRPTRRPMRLGLLTAAAVAVLAFLLGALVPFGGGTVEFDGVLVGADGAQGSLIVTRLAIGRTLEIRTDSLPILPTSEYYEVWFVGPEDRPDSPQRISAGTFHPDENGRSRITLTAAVDPTKFPFLSITAEPGDGNPAVTGPEVMRAELASDS